MVSQVTACKAVLLGPTLVGWTRQQELCCCADGEWQVAGQENKVQLRQRLIRQPGNSLMSCRHCCSSNHSGINSDGFCCAGGRAILQGILAEALQPLTVAAQATALSFAAASDTVTVVMLDDLVTPVARLQTLMSGLAATYTHALLQRAPGVAGFASSLRVSQFLDLEHVQHLDGSRLTAGWHMCNTHLAPE